MGTKRIDLSLFDDSLKALINASAKIFPMSLSDVQSNLNPNLYEYARIIDTGVHKNEIYLWNGTIFELIGADDKTVDFVQEVINKPLSYPNDLAHNHTNLTALETITALLITSWNGAVTHINDLVKHITGTERTLWNTVSTKADATATTNALVLKSDSTHDHDGRYNTKAEIASALGGKSDTTHDHNLLYAVKATEGVASTNSGLITGLRTDVNTNTNTISTIQTNMANGDFHSNIGILNQLTQILLDNWNSAVTHISDIVKHITGAERIAWNAKSNFSGVYTDLTSKPVIPTVVSSLTNDSNYQTGLQVTTSISGKADKSYVDTQDATKVDSTTFTGHTGNTTVHVLQTDKDGWNAKVFSGEVSGAFLNNMSSPTGIYHTPEGPIMGLPGGWWHIIHTIHSGGGYATQIAMQYGFEGTGFKWRNSSGTSSLTWNAWIDLASLSSPAFINIPTAPTAPTATNTTQLATTAFVKAQGYVKIVQGITEPAIADYWFKEV